jgi:hypothetical protein
MGNEIELSYTNHFVKVKKCLLPIPGCQSSVFPPKKEEYSLANRVPRLFRPARIPGEIAMAELLLKLFHN